MRKVVFISILLSYLLLQGTTFIRYISLKYDFFISFILFFSVLFVLFKKYQKYINIIYLCFIVTISCLLFLVFLINNEITDIGLPNMIGILISCSACYLYIKINKRLYKLFILLISFSICLFYFLFGFNYWVNYINYSNFNQKIKKTISPNWITFINYSPELHSNNKFILLDFFNTACPVCFKKFPLLQKTYDKYKYNNKILIYAVNIPWEKDTTGMAIQIIMAKKYSFPVLLGKKKLDSIFGVQVYPTTILLRNDTILFKGNIENVNSLIEEELRK